MAPLLAPVLGLGVWLASGAASVTDPAPPPVPLVVEAGRPLRVALDARTRLRKAGQPVTGTLVDPVYVYDRVVIPAGSKVRGHIAKLAGVPRGARARAILAGDLTPLRRAVLEFDMLVGADGKETPIRTEVRSATARVALQTRSEPGKKNGLYWDTPPGAA